MHRIVNNVPLGFIEITVSGFWDVDHLDDFARDLAVAIRDFPAIGETPASLYNFTDASIQPQIVVAKMQEMARSPAFAGRRVALYTDGSLARLQAKRVSEAGANMRVFYSRADALEWLAASRPIMARPAGMHAQSPC